jgi:hypothetical protein
MDGKKLTMAEYRDVLESTIASLGMCSNGVYRDRGCPTILVSIIDLTDNWAVDRLELEERINDPREFIRLIKQRHLEALYRLQNNIDEQIVKLGGTVDPSD